MEREQGRDRLGPQSQADTPEEGKSSDYFVQPPAINLPKGGGAIRGMGEKFAANPVTGTGAMTVPIATSPGRSGFGPQLALSYDSGAGNGPFGFGWNLSLPAITRKTDKGLPQFRDTEESDVFILSGAEDLVPVYKKKPDGEWALDANGRHVIDEEPRDGYLVRRYRPRIEGLFARIERWTRQSDGDVHWRSISKDNILTIYGMDTNSRITDPEDAERIFSWLICETRDDKGNAVIYEYKPEDGAGVTLSQAHEHNRGDLDDLRRTANRYLKYIRYGNRTPLLDGSGKRPRFLTDTQIQDAGWMFELVFDYGEHDADTPKPVDPGQWDFREDPFSTYRAGFEVRTTRLCQRVLMFHHFDGEVGVGNDCLVRSTDFTYSHKQDPDHARNPICTFLRAVMQSGYKRQDGGYLKRSLPPLEFEYTQPVVQDTVEVVDSASLENLPIGVDGTAYRWTDLHGEGIPGLLTEQAGDWFYKRNLSPIGSRSVELAPLERVAVNPNLALAGGAQFMDLAGDGQPDLVALDGPMPGLYEHDGKEGWQPFRPFTSRLNRDTRDPNLRFVDLDGDGHADVLITENDAFVWHASLAEAGFGPARRVAQALDEEKGPRLVFADGTQSIYLADLSGDGLTDLVRIRNSEVCYWPNLGYSRFGAKVSMDQAPQFDHPDQFDHQRMRLADIDGTGTTDIIYLHRDGVRLYFNQSGNSWSEPQILNFFPQVDDLVSIVPTDLLGNGTACLVWSSPLPGDTQRPMRYVNLMGGQKPHLLVKTVNNLGAETHIQYVPSTKFYLQDKGDGKPWITRLPFPVHVVERVESYDQISHNRFATRYAYHHGYFDGEEREFRGFGMVEQWDTEEFAALTADGTLPETTNQDAASHVPPVLTKTWFHMGIYVGREQVSNFFAGLLDGHDRGEYYREPAWRDDDDEARKYLLEDSILPDGLTIDEAREACRALKGSMLRQEVYALDGTDTEDYPHGHPYTVTEQNFTIKCLQPRDNNRHGVFLTHAREAINYHYERNDSDPRIGHSMTLEVDNYGNLLKSLAIGYGRRLGKSPLQGADKEKQEQVLITYTENDVNNAIDTQIVDPNHDPDNYRTPMPAETRSYEITGFKPEENEVRLSFEEFVKDDSQPLLSLREINYEEPPDYSKEQKRLIECVRTLYRKDDLTGLLGKSQLETKALPGESYKLAFTPGHLTGVFRRKREDDTWDELITTQRATAILASNAGDGGGYVDLDSDDHWWIPSGRIFYHPDANTAEPAATTSLELAEASQHFFLPRKATDPFGHSSTIEYEHDLLVTKTKDAIDNIVRAANDYRVLQPAVVIGPNGNRSFAAFDALGLVVATAVRGKQTESLGDFIDDFTEDTTQELANPTLSTLQGFVAGPQDQAANLLKRATTRIVYDLDRYHRCGQPPFAATLTRETHVCDLEAGEQTKIQISISYSDGFGREIQKKIQAEAGDAPQRQENVRLPFGDIRPGDLLRDAQGELLQTNTPRRWVGSGRTVFNNKGKPIRQYEPFFSATHLHELEREMTDTGVSPVLFYDPAVRVVATLHPNHTYEKVVFDPWQQTTYDVNDTVAASGEQTGDPHTDPDIADYVKAYFETQSDDWQTWYAQRQRGGLGPQEQAAAEKAAAHADTPATAYFDTLGRPFLTVEHNKVVCPNHNLDGTEEKFSTRVELDIEGNQRTVIDAKERVVMRYDYYMAGSGENEEGADNLVHQASMEAGARWMLNDVTGNPIRSWDSRGFLRRVNYDALRRPIALYVSDNGQAEFLAEKSVYGETPSVLEVPELTNHRGKPYRVYDSAGMVTSEAYDFKGNLLRGSRQFCRDYKKVADWQQDPELEEERFYSSTCYDALSRPVQMIAPHSDKDGVKCNILCPGYNKANLLVRVDAWLQQVDEPQDLLKPANADLHAVSNIDYNAKGQRIRIEYGNSAVTSYKNDPLTFRLTCLHTTRPTNLNDLSGQLFKNAGTVQDLRYTYDPAGNITRIADAALPAVHHGNQLVEPVGNYTYDALYRLIEAQGREHIGQSAFQGNPPDGNYRDFPFAGLGAQANDPTALRNYSERYVYDEVGNFLRFHHQANGGTWQRDYVYEEPSLVEPNDGVSSNRLSRTILHPNGAQPVVEPYTHDAHGNITRMPHLPVMEWDFKDQLSASSRQAVNNGGTPEITYYFYDAAGQRVRKVTERQAVEGETPTRRKERLYLGGFEIYREYDGGGDDRTKVRETLHVLDDKQRIALVETATFGAGSAGDLGVRVIRYQLGNHLSSASLELDRDGALISYEEYLPYGSTAFQACRSSAEISLKRYRYTGKERDEETGFNYHGARYYAAWLGRWGRCDPVGIEDDVNTYSYSADNPARYEDLNGLQVCDPSIASCENEVLYNTGNPVDPRNYAKEDTQNPVPLSQANETPDSSSEISSTDETQLDPRRSDIPPRDEYTLRSAEWTRSLLRNYRKDLEKSSFPALLMLDRHSGGSAYDFYFHPEFHDDLFLVPGYTRPMTPDEFGNYIAGYAAGILAQGISEDTFYYGAARDAGSIYGLGAEIWDQGHGAEWRYLGDNARSVTRINQGYWDARREKLEEGSGPVVKTEMIGGVRIVTHSKKWKKGGLGPVVKTEIIDGVRIVTHSKK